MQRAALIVNPHSRRGREGYELAVPRLTKSRLRFSRIAIANERDSLVPEVRSAIRSQIPLVIVGGGDGTMSSVAEHFVGQSASVLGVLPLGTGNEFARDIGIPIDVEAACDVLATGRPIAVDLGQVGSRCFVNVLTVGLSTIVAHELHRMDKRRFGRLAYAWALMRAMGRVRPFEVRLRTEEGEQVLPALQVVLGSGRLHAGPFPITPEAQLTDHRLSGYVLATRKKSVLLRYAVRLWGGRHVDLPEVKAFSASQGRIECSPRQVAVIDGEWGPKTPFDFRVLPAGLRVMAPAGDKAHRPVSG